MKRQQLSIKSTPDQKLRSKLSDEELKKNKRINTGNGRIECLVTPKGSQGKMKTSNYYSNSNYNYKKLKPQVAGKMQRKPRVSPTNKKQTKANPSERKTQTHYKMKKSFSATDLFEIKTQIFPHHQNNINTETTEQFGKDTLCPHEEISIIDDCGSFIEDFSSIAESQGSILIQNMPKPQINVANKLPHHTGSKNPHTRQTQFQSPSKKKHTPKALRFTTPKNTTQENQRNCPIAPEKKHSNPFEEKGDWGKEENKRNLLVLQNSNSKDKEETKDKVFKTPMRKEISQRVFVPHTKNKYVKKMLENISTRIERCKGDSNDEFLDSESSSANLSVELVNEECSSKDSCANIKKPLSPFFNTASEETNDCSESSLFPIPRLFASKTDIEEERIGPHSFIARELLGKGSFGEVYLVEKVSSKRFFAMKVLDKNKIMKHNLIKYALTERNVLSICNHPFIVRLNYAFQTSQKLFLILDYCPGADLSEYIKREKRFTEARTRIYIAEVILALEFLHKRDIIFRDLKPDNVVLDQDGHALLTDFGLAKEGVRDYTNSFCGSVAYLAPEMLKRLGHGKSVDWYLLGVLMYEMIVGQTPYYSPNREELFFNIQKGTLLIPSNLSPEAKHLLLGLLTRNPNKRLGGGKRDADEIKSHPFFQDFNWDDVYHRKLEPPKPMIKYQALITELDLARSSLESSGSTFHESNTLPGWSFNNPASPTLERKLI